MKVQTLSKIDNKFPSSFHLSTHALMNPWETSVFLIINGKIQYGISYMSQNRKINYNWMSRFLSQLAVPLPRTRKSFAFSIYERSGRKIHDGKIQLMTFTSFNSQKNSSKSFIKIQKDLFLNILFVIHCLFHQHYILNLQVVFFFKGVEGNVHKSFCWPVNHTPRVPRILCVVKIFFLFFYF